MASSPDGKPLGESPEALFYDSVNLFASTVVTNVAYGVMLALYAICVHYFWRQMTSENRRRTTFYLCYITTMAVLGTFTVIMSAWTANIAFVKHRLYPKGPGAYIITMHSQPCMVLSGVSWMLSNFMADGLVLWRFIVVYLDTQFFYLIAIIPCLMYVGSMCFGLLTVVQSARSPLLLAARIDYIFIFFGLTISITCLVTLAIFGRLCYYRRYFRRASGHQCDNRYTGIVAMLVESAALYTLVGMVFVILYGIGNAMKWVFLDLLGQVQIIAPLLITFRVSRGQAWSRDTHSTLLSSFLTTQQSTCDCTISAFGSDQEAPTAPQAETFTVYKNPTCPTSEDTGSIGVAHG